MDISHNVRDIIKFLLSFPLCLLTDQHMLLCLISFFHICFLVTIGCYYCYNRLKNILEHYEKDIYLTYVLHLYNICCQLYLHLAMCSDVVPMSLLVPFTVTLLTPSLSLDMFSLSLPFLCSHPIIDISLASLDLCAVNLLSSSLPFPSVLVSLLSHSPKCEQLFFLSPLMLWTSE